MKLSMNEKGGLLALIMIPIGIVILLVAYQLIDAFNGQAFNALDASTSSHILYVPLIKIVLGSIAILMTLMWLKTSLDSVSRPDSQNFG